MKTLKDAWIEIRCLWKRVKKLEQKGGGGIQSIQEGDNISIDNTDSQNPIISAIGGSGETEIPDWQEQSYSQGDIVAHNGGIWRSKVDNNEDEPAVCTNSWEITDNFTIVDINNNPTTQVIPSGNLIRYTGGEAVSIGFWECYLVTSDIPIGTSWSDARDNYTDGDVVAVIYDIALTAANDYTCETFLNEGYYNIVFYDFDNNITYELLSCPFTDFVVECPWTLLSEINSGFMTLNSRNEVTGDWSINTEEGIYVNNNSFGINSTEFDGSTQITRNSIILSSLNQTLFSANSDNISFFGFGDDEVGRGKVIQSDDFNDGAILSIGNNSGVIVTSVNGEFADEYGNIDIEVGGTAFTLQDILDNGNEALGYINLKENETAWGQSFLLSSELSFNDSAPGALDNSSFGRNYINFNGNSIGLLADPTTGLIISDASANRGLVGLSYYGANYNNNTYVQKKYVDDNTMINPILITGYNAGATQTLKNISGVLTWVTD